MVLCPENEMKMNTTTKRIDPALLEGKKPLATGYKVFNWDWTGYGDYCYADENGNVEGSVHTVTGEISECKWGLHYCLNPLNCMKYRDIVQWNKFALVEAYDENINGADKSVCRTLKIKKVLSFNEMVGACRSYQKDAANNGISYGEGISYGYGIRNVEGVRGGYGIHNGGGVNLSMHCYECEGVSRCIFCAGLEGAKLMLFNKPVNEGRFNEVWCVLNKWRPDFTNVQKLKAKYGNGEWKQTPAPVIIVRTAKEAYAEMPDDLRDYVKALPEYDDEIFRAITEAE